VKSRTMFRVLLGLLALMLAVFGLLAVYPSGASAVVFTNGSFQDGNFTGWTKSTYLNPGLTLPQPFTGASIIRNPGGADLTNILGPVASMSLTDANTGGVLHYPLSGPFCAVINPLSSSTYAHGRNANSLLQTDTIMAADVNPFDGKVHINFAWAAVVQNPVHNPNEQPYIYVELKNATTNTSLYETFIFAGVGSIWQNAAGSIQFTDWQLLDVAVDTSVLPVGDDVKVEAVASGCSLGGHWGYLYVDDFGSYWPVTPHVTAADKYFDGTASATLTGYSLTGVNPGDDVTLTVGPANFSSAAVGAGKTVTVTGLVLTGADAGKYVLSSLTATTTASILALAPPTVTTAVASNVTTSTASSGGDVTDGGGAAVTARGVCWSTSPNPTTANSHTTDGTGTGTFTSAHSGLTDNTTYHVRAYATNSQGTSYGADRTFTTDCIVTYVTDGTAGATLTGNTNQGVPAGSDATAVTANAPPGYHFVDWTFSIGGTSGNNPLTLSPVTGSVNITANYAINTYTVAFQTDGTSGTTLTGTASQLINHGSDATAVTANAPTGYHFVNWTGTGGFTTTTSNPVTVTGVTQDMTLTANYAIDTFAVSYTADANGSISGTPLQTVDYGSDATMVTAVPDAHYHFVSWSDGVLTASRTDTDVIAPISVTASFALTDPLVQVNKRLATDQSQTIGVGGTVSYVLTVANTGETTMSLIPLSDVFDSGRLAFVSATRVPDTSATPTLTWNNVAPAGGLAPGTDTTLGVTFRATAAGANVANRASVTGAVDASGYPAPMSLNLNTETQIYDPAQFEVTKTANPPAGTIMLPGQTITYTLAWHNAGPVAVPAVAINDPLSDSAAYVAGSLTLNDITQTDAADADAGTYESGTRTVHFDPGSVSPDATGTATFRVTIAPADVSFKGVLNTAYFGSGATALATAGPINHPVDPFDIVKTARDLNGGALNAGDEIEWTITVTNTGLVPTTHTVVRDTVPSQTTYVTGSIAGPGADASRAPDLVWNVGDIPVGGHAVVTFRSKVNAGLPRGTEIRNQASAQADQSALKLSDFPATAQVGDSTLLRTGVDDRGWLALAAVLLAGAGAAWVLGTRRERHA